MSRLCRKKVWYKHMKNYSDHRVSLATFQIGWISEYPLFTLVTSVRTTSNKRVSLLPPNRPARLDSYTETLDTELRKSFNAVI